MKLIYMPLCFLIPGSSLAFSEKKKTALLVPVLGLLWVFLFSETRWVLKPFGFGAMILGIAGWHITTYLYGFFLARKTHRKASEVLTLMIALTVMNLAIVSLSHHYKTRIFGFGFYYIKSNSMQPTLSPNDIVVVDTWVKKSRSIAIKDIVIYLDAKRKIEIIKRVDRLRNNELRELYVLGDNPRHSMDSRHFGWINESQLTAKACFILYSFSEKTQSFTTL